MMLLAALLLVAGQSSAASSAGPTDRPTPVERVSVAGESVEASWGHGGAITPDGRYVAFYATDLEVDGEVVPQGAFVRDRLTDSTELVSVGFSGDPVPVDTVRVIDISDDGSRVLFMGYEAGFVPGDTNRALDVFVRDLAAGTTERASVRHNGSQLAKDSGLGVMSGDGRMVTFSTAGRAAPNDTNRGYDVFVRNIDAHVTRLVSRGAADGAHSSSPSISEHGRFVAFDSDATALVPGDTNDATDVFVRDRMTDTTTLVSTSSAGDLASGDSYSPAVSPHGAFVSFFSYADDLVAGDTNGFTDVFLHDVAREATTRVSVSTTGGEANGDSWNPRVSSRGGVVMFESDADNLVGGPATSLYVHNRFAERTRRVATDSNSRPVVAEPACLGMTPDGRSLLFCTADGTVVGGDTNDAADLFVRQLRRPT